MCRANRAIIAGMMPRGLPDHSRCDLRWMRPGQGKLAAMACFRRPAVVALLVVLFVVLAVQGDAGIGLLAAALVVLFECLVLLLAILIVDRVLAQHHVPAPPRYDYPPTAPGLPGVFLAVPTPPPRFL